MELEQFEQLIRTRRAVRHFNPDSLPEGMVERLLECARWAPSGYNLQPVHFFVVESAERKPPLRAACMDQAQVEEAPVTVVFCGDRQVVRHNFAKVLKMDKEAGAISPRYEARLRKFVPLALGRGPLGIGWLWKAVLPPSLRLFTPIPELPAVYRDRWLTRQTMLAAMNFMLAAHAAGLATVPMEGFDERRLRRVLKLPRRFLPVLVVPLGYPRENPEQKKTRLPVSEKIHRI